MLALVITTGCSATAGTGSTLVRAPVGGCQAASPSDIASVKERLRDQDNDIVDAYVVPVPAIEQVSDGFPDYIFAARFTSPTEESLTGTWSLGVANNVKTVFPLDETAKLLADSAFVRPDSAIGKMLGKYSDSKYAVAARGCAQG